MLRRFVILALGLLIAAPAVAADHLVLLKTKAKFEDVKEDVVNAVTKRGLVIDYTAYIGAMLDRTAKDIGAARQIYAKAEAVQFCSAVLSRKTVEADPSNIVFCPYVVVYSLAADPGTVYVGYRRLQPVGSPAARASLKAVDDLLSTIVREAAKAK